MYKEIVDDARRTPDIGQSQKLTMSTLCSGELEKGNNSKLRQAKLKFICTALPLDEIYPPTKFHNHSLYSLGDMHRKKFKYKKKTKGNNSKIKQARITVHIHCTTPS